MFNIMFDLICYVQKREIFHLQKILKLYIISHLLSVHLVWVQVLVQVQVWTEVN